MKGIVPFPFLDVAVPHLLGQGWRTVVDEAGYLNFRKNLGGSRTTFIYQVFETEGKYRFVFIADMMNQELNDRYGHVAQTTFNDVPLRQKTFEFVTAKLSTSALDTVVKEVVSWCSEVSVAYEIEYLADHHPTFNYQWLRHVAAKSLLGKSEELTSMFDTLTDGSIGNFDALRRALDLSNG